MSGNNDTSKSMSWKVLETALSHLNTCFTVAKIDSMFILQHNYTCTTLHQEVL